MTVDTPDKPAKTSPFVGLSSSERLTPGDISRIIEMAWEDRTSFEAIERQFGINESAVIRLMRAEMKASSFRMWRKRMSGRATKHEALRSDAVSRHRARHTRQA